MTALPDPTTFLSGDDAPVLANMSVRPRVTEKFWGYEIALSQSEMWSATILRTVATVAMAIFGCVAIGLAVVPSDAFLTDAGDRRLAILLALLSAAAASCFVASRCRRIRIEVDTQQGEIRQVTTGQIGSTNVLSCHGLDTVSSVEVVASSLDRSFGQIHMRLNGFGTIAVADGCVTALSDLRRRLANDAGLSDGREATAFWSGPLDRV